MSPRLALLLAPLLLACGKTEDTAACTEIGCQDGLFIELNRLTWEPGVWTVSLTSDGVNTTCTATIPLDSTTPSSCDRTGYQLTTAGSSLDVSEQAITDLYIPSIDIAQVTIIVEHDGVEVFSDSVQPSYQTSQPNGPDCEPTCTSANASLTLD